MCGIAGWIDFERDLSREKKVLEKMSATLVRRGPDAEGFWFSPRAAFAHRRLIVIDPECGAQPMQKEGPRGLNVITFNGEIYNYRELKVQLEGMGHRFVTQSDTEVILTAYIQWGEDCVLHLNGIFAFAIWDEAKQQVFLARDHLGVKPLFYARTHRSFVFGSEIKALLAHPFVSTDVGTDGMAHIFSFMPFHVPGFGYFRDIEELKPGHSLAITKHGRCEDTFWSLHSAPHFDDLERTTETIRAILSDTVRRQLIADVPVVTMLSGGVDSSGITALAAREFHREGKQLTCYSLDFVDSARYFVPNEMHLSLDMPWAKRVADYVNVEQRVVLVDSQQLLDHILEPMRARDLPGLGQMETSLYLLFKEMKQHATVALSGESADEVFGGYPWFFKPAAVSADTFPWLAMMHSMWQVEGVNLLHPHFAQLVQPERYIRRCYRHALEEMPRLEGEDPIEARRREMFFLNLTHWLPVLLDRKDRMSMACGFEVRVPFCDYRLVDYVWNVPWSMKMIDDIEKGVLRRALNDVLPHDVLYRKKSPYPASQHPAYADGVKNIALTILDNPDSAIRPYLNLPEVRSIAAADTSQASRKNTTTFLERMIQIEGWLKEYKVRFVADRF